MGFFFYKEGKLKDTERRDRRRKKEDERNRSKKERNEEGRVLVLCTLWSVI